MGIFLLIIGVFYVIVGTLSIFATNLVKRKFFNKFKDMDYKKMSFIPILIGILFIISAKSTNMPLYIVILGILAILKGFYGIFESPEKINRLMEKFLNAKNRFYKIYGVVALLIGVGILVSIQ